MVDFRDKIIPGSFRGVPFDLTDVDQGGGRLSVLHEFPQRDLPFTEDLGRQGRTFSMQAFVLGDDYFEKRDALQEALETEGPGILIHPYRGTLLVQCLSFRIRESATDGRLATFAIEFAEAGEVPQPSEDIDTQADVTGASEATDEAGKTFLEQVLDVLGFPQFVADSAAGVVDSAGQAMDAALAPVKGFAEDVETLSRTITELQADAITLVTTPSQLAVRMSEAFQGFEDALDPSPLFEAMTNMFPFGPSEVDPFGQTLSRQQKDANDRAIESLTRIGALSTAARALSQIIFTSDEEAFARRDELVDIITEEVDLTDDDDVFATLSSLRASIVNDISLRVVNIASVVNVQLDFEAPSLVVSHALYDDAERDEEIFGRNTSLTNHPGFLPENIDLSVLSNV